MQLLHTEETRKAISFTIIALYATLVIIQLRKEQREVQQDRADRPAYRRRQARVTTIPYSPGSSSYAGDGRYSPKRSRERQRINRTFVRILFLAKLNAKLVELREEEDLRAT